MHPAHWLPAFAPLEQPFVIMGVINVTPDSFYDGGRYNDPTCAVEHGLRLIEEGAAVLDVGGESSQPGALRVQPHEELQRVIPVIATLRSQATVAISVDTTRAAVARMALDSGADWINDISAGRFDPEMAALAAEKQCPVVLTHSRKTPQDMQESPAYKDVVAEVIAELRACIAQFIAAGVRHENLILDPGIGFAKRPQDNTFLLRGLRRLVEEGYPVLVGTSRKSFIAHLTGRQSPQERLAGTLGSVAAAWLQGARLFRVHDVAATRDFLTVLSAIATDK
jgi:dihydropteroate synthase